jgi:hypothetical protein
MRGAELISLQTLDDTSVGAWANAATMAPFPSTPAQSFENMYNAHINTSPLGKRPLQLDVRISKMRRKHETWGGLAHDIMC